MVQVMVAAVQHLFAAVVSPHQAAWLRHRWGIKNVCEMQYWFRQMAASGVFLPILLLLDLEDAFPRSKRQALAKILAVFGFSAPFNKAVLGLYHNSCLFVPRGLAFPGTRSAARYPKQRQRQLRAPCRQKTEQKKEQH